MAMVSFKTFFPDISPHVQGCPDPVMEFYIRRVCIELCNRAGVWRQELTPTTLSSGTYNYTLAAPFADAEVVALTGNRLYLTTADAYRTLQMVTEEQARLAYSTWPDTVNTGEPAAIFQRDTTSFNVVPVPDDADTYELHLTATLRPTKAATTFEETVFYDNNSAIFHGVLYELMLMPDRPWTNEKMALIHGKHWAHALNSARARANKGFGRADVTVQMRPWA